MSRGWLEEVDEAGSACRPPSGQQDNQGWSSMDKSGVLLATWMVLVLELSVWHPGGQDDISFAQVPGGVKFRG